MSIASLTAPDAKTPRRRVAKSPKGEAPKPLKLSFYLTPESAKRLGITSTMEGKSQSAIVEELVSTHLRRWVVQDRSRSAGGSDQVADGEMIGTGDA